MSVESIINDIREASKESPKDLYSRLISERLQLAVKTYYKDLSYRLIDIDSKLETNVIKVAKQVLK